MAVDKKFFVDINLQGNALNNATIGSNSDMTKGGSFRFDGTRLEYYDGSSVQSVANLADIAAVTGGLIFQGGYDASTNTPNITDGTATKGFFWVVETAGSFLGESVQVGDSIIAKVNNAGASIGDWLILQGNVVIATDTVDGIVRLATQAEVDAGTEGGAVVVTPATLQSKIDSQITPNIDDKLSKTGGTMTGDITMNGNSLIGATIEDGLLGTQLNANGNSITNAYEVTLAGGTVSNVPTPTNATDAANKDYVDGAASTAQSNAETFATNAANTAESNANSYTDGVAATKLNLSGGTMSGNINMDNNAINNAVIQGSRLGNSLDADSNKIVNLLSPTNEFDASTKGYVDTAASTAQSNAETFATNAANTAQSNAESYAQTAANNARSAANGYTDAQITAQSSVKFVDTTAWVLDGDFYYAEVLHTLGSYVNFTTTMNGGQVVEFAATMGNNNIVLFSNTLPAYGVVVILSKVNNG